MEGLLPRTVVREERWELRASRRGSCSEGVEFERRVDVVIHWLISASSVGKVDIALRGWRRAGLWYVGVVVRGRRRRRDCIASRNFWWRWLSIFFRENNSHVHGPFMYYDGGTST